MLEKIREWRRTRSLRCRVSEEWELVLDGRVELTTEELLVIHELLEERSRT